MKAKKILVLLVAAIVVTNVTYLNAQVCGSSNLSLNKLVNIAELVVVGKVIDQQGFWYNEHNIYTRHTVKVEQSTNGSTAEIFIITEGGTINDLSFKVFGKPNLILNKQSIFFLSKNEDEVSAKTNGTTYNLTDLAFYNPFFNTIENKNSSKPASDFNKMMIIKHNKSFQFVKQVQQHFKTKQTLITNVSPLKIGGGSNDVLTINGSGFGNLSGSAKVSMRSPSSISSVVYEDIAAIYIISWSDTKIELIVPGDDITEDTAGLATGEVRITNEFGEIATSSQTVEVIYNKKVFSGMPVSLKSKDNNGTTAIYVERQLINDGALPAIENTLATWNCGTGSNLVYAGIVDGVCEKYDGLNVICYDATISSFTLGSTRVVSRNCSSIGWADQLDADIRINPNINWNFTDDLQSSEFHFESVMLHELGHAFMLGHVLNEEDIMYPTLYNGQNKSELTTNDIAGGLDVMSISTTENNCSSYGAISAYGSAAQCNPCLNVSNVEMKNVSEKSAYLSWDEIFNAEKYQFQYKFGGSEWYNYASPTNNVILFNLPPCTTIETRLLAFCDIESQSLNEATYTFITIGCQQ